jgi:predicted transcriptional regulator
LDNIFIKIYGQVAPEQQHETCCTYQTSKYSLGRILSPKNMRAFMALNIVANEKITETKPECINSVA